MTVRTARTLILTAQPMSATPALTILIFQKTRCKSIDSMAIRCLKNVAKAQ